MNIKKTLKKILRPTPEEISTEQIDKVQVVCSRAGIPRIMPGAAPQWQPLFPKPSPVPDDFSVSFHADLNSLVCNRSMEGYFKVDTSLGIPSLCDMESGHYYRMKMIAEVFTTWFGGKLNGQSFLDIGCSSGYYCFHADRLGADTVLGLDARPEHEEQFKLLHRMTGARDTCRYQHLDMEYGLEQFDQPHDIVSAQGVLYHVFDHPRFVKNLYRLTRKLVILEGACCGRTDEYCRPLIENPKDLRESIHGPVLYPSLAWMIDVMKWAGFRDITYINYPSDLPPSKAHDGLWRAMLVGVK